VIGVLVAIAPVSTPLSLKLLVMSRSGVRISFPAPIIVTSDPATSRDRMGIAGGRKRRGAGAVAENCSDCSHAG
jgi:hypothetical protein